MEKKFVICKDDIAANVSLIREKTNNKIIYAVLKGNAYGMGLIPFAEALFQNGIKHYALTDLNDALLLREKFADIEILLLTPCKTEDDIALCIDNSITLSVTSLENAKNISKIAKSSCKVAKLHIKIDTGMGRYGFLADQIDDILSISKLESIEIKGIYTHLHSAFNKDEKPSILQFNEFIGVIDKLEQSGLKIDIKHICNSTAIFRFPQMHLTAARAGSALIGRVSDVCGKTSLCKVGKLYGQVVDIKTLPKGHNIGYAALYKTKSAQKTVSVNIGYADGVAVTKANDTFRFVDILRYIYNNLKLIKSPTPLICRFNDKRLKSLGRIGMTNLVLDANGVDEIKCGDLVEVPVNPIYLSPLIKREYK